MEYASLMSPRESKADTPENVRAIEYLKRAFAASNLNRADLSERSGVPDGTLSGLLAGRRPLYADQVVSLARALGIEVGDWFDYAAGNVSDFGDSYLSLAADEDGDIQDEQESYNEP